MKGAEEDETPMGSEPSLEAEVEEEEEEEKEAEAEEDELQDLV